MTSVPITIHHLADHPTHASTLGRWHFAEWSRLMPWWTEQAAIDELAGHTSRTAVPTTLVALHDGLPVGSISLLAHDLPEWPQYSPWLASLYVREDVRGRGIGAALVDRLIQEAESLELPVLYLFTTNLQEWYARWGWSAVEELTYHGVAGTIMRRTRSPRG
ncbi:MAG: GNAT family N-acetyltransferase [Gemmatimonadaceae bacterium]